MNQNHIDALRALISSFVTGEHSAAVALESRLAPHVKLSIGNETHAGREAVSARLSGRWALTVALRHTVWSDPTVNGSHLHIEGTIEGQAAYVPSSASIDVSFDDSGLIDDAIIQLVNRPMPAPEPTIPRLAQSVINTALSRDRPISVAHVDLSGAPVQTFRGSIQVFNDTQLCAWIRFPTGNFARSIAVNPRLSLTYQESPGSFLFIEGTGAFDTDERTRRHVFDMIPEVERNHDPQMTGAALIIDVTSIRGWIRDRWIMMQKS